MSKRWADCWATWGRLHPTWQTHLWTDGGDFDNEPMAVDGDPRERADRLRYALLYFYGGVYVDVDFECLRPIDPLLEGVSAFAASEGDGQVSIGILGAEPFHPVFKAALDTLPERKDHVSLGDRSGPAFFTDVVRYYETLTVSCFTNFTVFPSSMFYPYSGADARAGVPFDPASAPDAYAVHHWASIIHPSLVW